MNALAAANESATQMFGNIAIFPPGAEPEPFVSAPKKGKYHGYAQVSTKGQPPSMLRLTLMVSLLFLLNKTII
jgi:hypothetical protein